MWALLKLRTLMLNVQFSPVTKNKRLLWKKISHLIFFVKFKKFDQICFYNVLIYLTTI